MPSTSNTVAPSMVHMHWRGPHSHQPHAPTTRSSRRTSTRSPPCSSGSPCATRKATSHDSAPCSSLGASTSQTSMSDVTPTPRSPSTCACSMSPPQTLQAGSPPCLQSGHARASRRPRWRLVAPSTSPTWSRCFPMGSSCPGPCRSS